MIEKNDREMYPGEEKPVSVGQLNQYIKSLLDSNPYLQRVYLRGEISNFTNHRTGHLYFSLKDQDGLIRAVMFRTHASSLAFLPENGMKVLVRGTVSVFPRDGSYQVYVASMEPDGIGALYLAFEKLKKKLEAEGLFDPARKRRLPKIPTRVGVITSPTGAAVRDIIHVLGRRFPFAEVVLYPALVQGADAPKSLIEGIRYFNRESRADLLIIGRGGGSIEDLWAFNDEALAREIASSKIPTISAVGHETDFTIADFVADLRAPTPSAAAEMAVPERRELMKQFSNVTTHMHLLLQKKLERERAHLKALEEAPPLKNPAALLREPRMNVGYLLEKAASLMNHRLLSARSRFAENAAKLEAMSPLSILGRGYAAAMKEGKLIRSLSDVKPNDSVSVRLSDGAFLASVQELCPKTRD